VQAEAGCTPWPAPEQLPPSPCALHCVSCLASGGAWSPSACGPVGVLVVHKLPVVDQYMVMCKHASATPCTLSMGIAATSLQPQATVANTLLKSMCLYNCQFLPPAPLKVIHLIKQDGDGAELLPDRRQEGVALHNRTTVFPRISYTACPRHTQKHSAAKSLCEVQGQLDQVER
jgi:hypothetical protein